MTLTDEQRARLRELLSKPQWPAMGSHARLMLDQDDGRRRRAGRSTRRRSAPPVDWKAVGFGLLFLATLIALAMGAEAMQ